MASKQASRFFVTVVVALLAISTLGHTTYSTEEGGGGDEYKEVKKEAAPESKEAAASESWAGWAQEKLSEGLGIKHGDHESHSNKETATEKKQQTEKVRDDEEQVSTPAKEKAKEIYDKAKNKAGESVEAAKHKSKSKSHEQVKDNVAAGGGDHPEELCAASTVKRQLGIHKYTSPDTCRRHVRRPLPYKIPAPTHPKRTLGTQYLMASKQASRVFVTVVVALLAISTLGHTTYSTDEGGGGGGEYKEVKEEAATESKEAAASESWAGWAQEKLSEGLGIKHESHSNKETATEKKQQTERVRDDDEDQVSPAKEKAKEVYDKAKNKAGETVEAAKHTSKSHQEVKDNVAAGGGQDHLEEL
ncbi:late embryogenesis abundant protein D-29-like [Corylus avellana]|uniref:late embryogenesis abundant protein D-29-like n=1 Tax=Corylus avellana TaxID=13451 RepID=UPI00286A5A10|nr:late embryogenesis abundant protein D-29-like [Corylus avellana]